MYLGQNRSSSDTGIFCITTHNAIERSRQMAFKAVSINKKMVRKQTQCFNGPAHGKEGGVKDIDLVYFLMTCRSNGPSGGFNFNLLSQNFPNAACQLLRVVDQFIGIIFRQYYRRRYHGPAETPPACFITSRFYSFSF